MAPAPLMALPTVEVLPAAPVNCKVDPVPKAIVLPVAPNEPPVPMANVLLALTVVVPANALLLPVNVTTPVPA